jgi:hypothetical protein
MRTLNVHTADDLAVRWKRRAFDLNNEARGARTVTEKARLLDVATAYRACAAELDAITAVTMEMEATHHGDPEDGLGRPGWRCGAEGPERGQTCDLSVGHDGPHCKAPPYGTMWAQTENDPQPTSGYDAHGNFHVGVDPNALMEWSQGGRP